MSDVSDNVGAVFCVACANKLVPTAAFCPKCGTPRAHVANQGVNPGDGKKSKTTAVLLAVFLSYWTWLYSYKIDAAKFYVGLGLNLVLGLGFIVVLGGLWLEIDAFGSSVYAEADLLYLFFFSDPLRVIYVWLTYFVSLVVWVWAIISAARKPSRF